MAWKNFLERWFPTKERVGSETVIIDIPDEIYYKELAIYTASSYIANAISRSEMQVYVNGIRAQNEDYYLLNVSPNRNETSSYFWHRIINKMIREKEALVVEAGGYLYCANSFTREQARPILGDVYSNVDIGDFTFSKVFTQADSYLFRLDNMDLNQIISGLYDDYAKFLKAAASSFRRGCGQKYKLHLRGIRAGDEEFNKVFENVIKKQLKDYIQNDSAVYPEYDGYDLQEDTSKSVQSSGDIIALRKDIFSMVASALHIPDSMMTGNITNIKDVINSFLTFGVDPYADAITEALNKRAGPSHYSAGNYYRCDTSKIQHRDIFEVATAISSIIGSGVKCIDEVRELLGDAPLNTDWSQKHFITKNFEELERFLKGLSDGGGEKK